MIIEVAPETAGFVGSLPDHGASIWADALQRTLRERLAQDLARDLFERYAGAFPSAYRERFKTEIAVADILRIEQVLAAGELGVDLHRSAETVGPELRGRFYQISQPVALSVVLPVLENMGLQVIEGFPYQIRPAGGTAPVWIQDFGMVTSNGCMGDLDRVRKPFHDAFTRLWRGEVENDGFNRLVLGAALSWREIVVLRAYCKYLRQLGLPFSQTYMEQTLAGNPILARRLVELFNSRFDPARPADTDRSAETILREIHTGLDAVASLDEDRILRRFLNIIQATLRTNYFQKTADGAPKPYLSFKFDGLLIEELPLPRPRFEIFVYSPRLEGVHLRGGRVARGGLRWSDRPEDFRAEILGLLKAQMVKNVVIVPEGAKGGFVVKGRPSDGGTESPLAEGVECYRDFIRGLLDVTDNRREGRTVPPLDTVRWDEDDPYLVVAADKGTATFSDIANEVAREYGFWLEDAFASGGSAGYDHKKMGITARGAWEAVKRHFREMGVDIQSQDSTVIGVGDMSGDVFGNGMLLSRHIKLLGAFNHRHIFVDPDPDPNSSWNERQRLFELPCAAWSDYSSALVAKGGGIFDRKAKAIRLTLEIKRLFEIPKDIITPNELIRAMLRAPADLLWLGGIGTYVKASTESHAEVGDRNNDAVRIDAKELRCRVIGEGANLGLTQRARIEYALHGGRLNTDAIDNAAGVNCSDHEVNIKIVLNQAVAQGVLGRGQRDALLTAMTDEVARLVLRDNYLQTQAITLTQAQAVERLDRQTRVMQVLERGGQLDRTIEFLPDDETLVQRRAANIGLTRPEIAVLLAYTKLAVYRELLPSDLPDDPLLVADLVRYFPVPLREEYRGLIENHPLRREIIATTIVNSMINRVGSGFVNDMQEQTGMSDADVARAYTITRDIFDLPTVWRQIETLDNRVTAALQTALMLETSRLVEHVTLWFLRGDGYPIGHPLNITATVAEFGPDIAALTACLETVVAPADQVALVGRMGDFNSQGVPVDLARRIAGLELLASACDIVRIARTGAVTVQQAGRLYFAVGARFGLNWLRSEARRLAPESYWHKQAIAALVDDLYGHQRALTSSVIALGGAATEDADSLIVAWIARRPQAVERMERRLNELKGVGALDISMLVVVSHQFGTLINSGW